MASKDTVVVEGLKETVDAFAHMVHFLTNPFNRAFDRAILYMETRTALTFQQLAYGGDFRGVHWEHWAESSLWTKRAGTGELITPDTPIMWATGTLAGEAASVRKRDSQGVELGPVGNSEDYAPIHQELRPFLFFEEGVDDAVIAGMFATEINADFARRVGDATAVFGGLLGQVSGVAV